MDKRIKKILSLIPKSNKKAKERLLDIGCNDGTISLQLQKKGYSVLGIDNKPKNLSLAKSKGINVNKVDITKGLPYQNETFDLIFCGEILEHILDPISLIKEMYRILKNKGTFYLSIPNISSLRNAILILIGSFPAYASRYNGEHIRDFNKKDIYYLLSISGFKNIKFYGDKISIPIGHMRSIEILPFINTYSDYLIVIAKK